MTMLLKKELIENIETKANKGVVEVSDTLALIQHINTLQLEYTRDPANCDGLVSISYLLKATGVSRQAANGWTHAATFPKARVETRMGRLWSRDDLDQWLKTRKK